jgi:hypothetical protein
MEEYIAGDLDTDTESAIASHLSTCDTCNHELHLAQAIDKVLDDLPKPTSPPDILRAVTAYVRAHPNNSGWRHRIFQLSTFSDFLRTPFLRFSAIVCLVGIVVFGVHQYQQHIVVEQAKSDFNYALSKMNYAVQKTGLAVNDSFGSLKVDEAPRRALKPTAKISSAIHWSLGILNHLTGDIPNIDTITPKFNSTAGNPAEPTSTIEGENTQ